MRYPRVLILLLAAALATRSGAQGGVRPSPELARRVAALSGSPGERELEVMAVELARLPGAVEGYFSLCLEGLDTGDGVRTRLTRAQALLLERLARAFDSNAVVAHVRTALSEERSDDWLRVALELLGAHGGVSDLSLLARLATDPRESRPRPDLVGPFVEALAAVLRRGGVRPHELRWLVGEAEHLRTAIVDAVGRAEDPEGLVWLMPQLEDPTVGPAVLRAIARLAPAARGEFAGAVANGLHPVLRSADASARRLAIQALGELRRPASVPRLVLLLKRDVPAGERRMATTALRRITGANLPEDGAAWQDWFRREQDWLRDSAPALLEQLDSPDDGRVVGAAHGLSLHPLHRDRLARELARVLAEHDSPAVRAQLCLALGRLGSPLALPELVEVVRDGEPDERARAARALHEITGLEVADPRDWPEVLEPRLAPARG